MKNNRIRLIALLCASALSCGALAQTSGTSGGSTSGSAGTNGSSSGATTSGTTTTTPTGTPIQNQNIDSTTGVMIAPSPNPNSSPNPNPTSSPIINPNGPNRATNTAGAATSNNNSSTNPSSSPNMNQTPIGISGSSATTMGTSGGPGTAGTSATTGTNTGTTAGTSTGTSGTTATSGAVGGGGTVGTSGAVGPGSASTVTAMNASSNSAQVFSSLDTLRKGYLSQADVASNQYLSTNFTKCDTNSDGRLTQGETAVCMQGASASQR